MSSPTSTSTVARVNGIQPVQQQDEIVFVHAQALGEALLRDVAATAGTLGALTPA
ncbi:MAG TPA: hypothetical protein VET26_07800 [Candidatus Sulfotelmatobacter sp.]|nr:hypothetical protein [Candidatus Sulfotelmatobacter sp.]